jgi:hypothetical protein
MDIIKLSQFPNVAASSGFHLTTDELIEQSVHGLILEMGGTFTKAQITNLRVSIGGKEVLPTIAGDKLQAINTYNGMPDTTNYLFVWFGDPTARTIRGQHLGDLDLSIYRSPITIEGDIGAATGPTLQAYAITGVPKQDMGLGFDAVEASQVRALVRTVLTPAAAVAKKSYPIGVGSEAGARIRQVHFFHTNMTSLEFRKSSVVKYDDVSIALNAAIQAEFARVAAASHYVLDRIVDGNQGEAEGTIRPNDGRPWPLQFNVTTSAADTITAYADIQAAIPLL